MRRGGLASHQALGISRARGFTLLEMAVVLVIIGIMYAIWSYSVPWLQDTGMRDKTREIMGETEKALLLFAQTNSRLPCPDTNNNGLEGGGATASCAVGDGSVVGQVPYETLLLPAPVWDSRHVPITYALYRNAGAIADLGVLNNRIDTMDDVDESNVVTPTLNICDFCEALRNGEALAGGEASHDNGFASVSTQTTAAGGCGSGALLNQAYVLASSGLEDRDGVDGLFDGDNATAPATCFASPEQGVSDTYDDVVSAVSFKHLIGELCRSPVCLGPNPPNPLPTTP